MADVAAVPTAKMPTGAALLVIAKESPKRLVTDCHPVARTLCSEILPLLEPAQVVQFFDALVELIDKTPARYFEFVPDDLIAQLLDELRFYATFLAVNYAKLESATVARFHAITADYYVMKCNSYAMRSLVDRTHMAVIGLLQDELATLVTRLAGTSYEAYYQGALDRLRPIVNELEKRAQAMNSDDPLWDSEDVA